jgi:glycosyltransferase involved in cell wall biosynthesis
MTSADAPLLSIIVCTRNRARTLERALESLIAQDRSPGEWEIVVVDNGSTDDTAEVIRSFAGRGPVHYTFGDIPGLGGARNSGIAAARGRLLAFTDDDVIVHKDWAARIVTAFEQNPDVSAVHGYTYANADVPEMFSVRTRPHACYFEGKEAVFESSPGNNMAYRREVIDRIGGFDPSLGAGAKYPTAEDSDFWYRVLKAGLKAYYDPSIQVWHGPDVSSRPFQSEVLRSDAGIAAWYGKHAAMGDLFAARLFLVHLGRNVAGVRTLATALRRGDWAEVGLRRRRLSVLLRAFVSRGVTELAERAMARARP